MDIYLGLAKCVSEMSDAEIERIARVTEVPHTSEVSLEL